MSFNQIFLFIKKPKKKIGIMHSQCTFILFVIYLMHLKMLKLTLCSIQNKSISNILRATSAVSQNREQKPFLDAKEEKRCSSSRAIAGAKIWLLNSDKSNLAKYS